MASSNAIAVIPEGVSRISAGDQVTVLDWG